MKKYLLLFAVIGLFSCSQKKHKNGSPITKEFINEHTSENSLDWEGAYEMKFPDDSEWYDITIVLNKDKTFLYSGNNKRKSYSSEFSGIFTWNDSGNIVTLKRGGDFTLKFKVTENSIIQLDLEENPLSGDYIYYKK